MQRVSLHTLHDFTTYFKGSQSAYGCHQYEEAKDNKGKRSGKSWTKTGLATDKEYKAHLEGTSGLGIIPIDSNNKVRFCVIDIDDYTNRTDSYVDLIYSNNMPLVPFRSKSGGLHLYLFFREEIPATLAIQIMNKFRATLALPKETEIFPKQKKLKAGDHGNWINLPYFGMGQGMQGKITNGLEDAMGNILTLETALNEIKNKIQTKDMIEEFFETLPLQDAPPCLQTIYLAGDTHHRNDYLFNLACYFKSKYGDDFEHRIMEANMMLAEPLSASEVANTVNKGKGKEYTYKCNQEPICSYCNKSECGKREFGINGDQISLLNFEEFLQYKTDPPYYEWIVNGKGLKFFKEADIIKQDKFRELCFRELHILPNRLKDNRWSNIVNNALKNIVIKEVDPEDDMSPGAQFHEHLTEFLTKRALAQSKEQVLIDRVFMDQDLEEYIFKSKDLIKFLIQVKGFREFGKTEVQDRIRVMGGKPKRYYTNKKYGTIRVWSLPFKSINNFVEDAKIEEFEIDFQEKFDDKPW